MPIRLSRWILPAVPITVALAALTACTSPAPAPTPVATAKPVLENEEQALAAVTETMSAFLGVTSGLLADPAADIDTLSSVASSDQAEIERSSINGYRTKGWRTSAASSLHAARLQQWSATPDPVGVVANAYVCVDYSAVDVLDESGTSVVSPTREPRQAAEITLTPDLDATTGFVISKKTPVSDRTVCE